MKDATVFQSSPRSTFAEVNDCGVLIVFEGSDGSGKTTQRKLFKSWLKTMNEDVVVTKWNSSPLFKPVIKAKKAARSLDPVNFAHLHALDFRHRYETVIKPSLEEGKIVIADRYVFTGISRDAARGVSRDWSIELYSRVRRPDIVFYFSGSPAVFAARIGASRDIKFYESGQDVTGLTDPRESYLRFAPRVMAEYEKLRKQFGFIVVDAHQSIYEQHRFIRAAYLERFASPFAQSAAAAQPHLSIAI
jgi:dTMP kinase